MDRITQLRWVVFRAVLILAVIGGMGTILKGQPALQLGAQGLLNYPVVADLDDEFDLSFYVVNSGNSVFNDNIVTRQTINGNPVQSIDITGNILINPGDSVMVTITEYEFDSPQFNLGRNGIVVWVTDDNLSPNINEDSISVILTDGPAFRIGGMGITGFPSTADTSGLYSFDIEIENFHEDDYFDTLFVTLSVGSDTMEYPSTGKVSVQGQSSTVYTQSEVRFLVPPFAFGSNEVNIWVRGTGQTFAIDTLTKTFQLGPTTSIGEFTVESFSHWPNPILAGELLFIKAAKPLDRIMIADISGRIIYEAEVKGKEIDFNTEVMGRGVFILGIYPRSAPPQFQKLIVR